MPKVKVVKLYDADNCYECGGQSVFSPATEDWEEISNEQLEALQNAIYQVNGQIPRLGFTYVIVTYVEDSVEDLFKSYADLVAAHKRAQEAAEKKKEEEKAKRAAKALERKRKQLEKLKAELE